MTRDIFIALALGLVAAVVFVSATTGPLPVRLILFLITPLPLLLAGLGWGVRAALIAALAGTGLLMLAGPMVGAVFALSQAVPAAVLSYLALLNRPAHRADDADAETEKAPAREWYPAGRLVIWTAIMAALPAAIWTLIADAQGADLKQTLETALSEAFKAGALSAPGGTPITPEAIAQITSIIYAMLPSGSAIAWMSGLLLTLYFAGRIMLASGQLARPWPDLASMEFPPGTALAFLIALVVAFIAGPIGIVARAFLGAFLLAYVLLGLSIIHYVTRGSTWRPFILLGIYGTLLVLSAYAAIPIALIGLADTFLNFRRRYGQPSGSA
jgi:hypothetical protein